MRPAIIWWRVAGAALGVGASVGGGVAEAGAEAEGPDDAVGGAPLGDPGVRAAWDGFGVGVSAPHAARNSATPPAKDAPRNRRRVTVGAERPA
jgi:hypothetical protein